MPAKKSKISSTHKSIDIKPRVVSPTSRPVIVSNGPLLRDPMLSKTDDLAAPKGEQGIVPDLVMHEKRLMPLGEQVQASSTGDLSRPAPTAGELVEKLKSRQQNPLADDESEADQEASKNSSDATSDKDITPAPDDEEPIADAATAEDEVSADSHHTKDTVASEESDGKDSVDLAAHQAQIDNLAESGKYFVPINVARERHARQWLAVSAAILVVIIALDLLLDAGILKISGFNFYTNFFHR